MVGFGQVRKRGVVFSFFLQWARGRWGVRGDNSDRSRSSEFQNQEAGIVGLDISDVFDEVVVNHYGDASEFRFEGVFVS